MAVDQMISGVTPPAVAEATVMTVWPSVASTGLGRSLGRLYRIKGGFGPLSIGRLTLLATVPLIVLSYLLILAVAETFPTLPLLDPTEPRDALFHLATGLGDSLPMLAVWSGLIFLPQALRANEERSAEIALLRHEAELLRLQALEYRMLHMLVSRGN